MYEVGEEIEVSDNEVKWYIMKFVSKGEDGVMVEGNDWKYGRFTVGMTYHRKLKLNDGVEVMIILNDSSWKSVLVDEE